MSLYACAVPGDRAATGDCPAGETCSPLTLGGLYFRGLGFSDQWFDEGLHPTAAGGSQPINLFTDVNDTPLRVPFTPLVTDDAFIATSRASSVELAASAAATGYLRIVDNEGLLMDRVTIASLAPTRFELRAVGETLEPGRAIALAPGRRHRLVVAMIAADGSRVVDGDLQITVAGRVTTPIAWDTTELDSDPSGATIQLDVEAGSGLRGQFAVESRGAADAVTLQAHDPLVVGTGVLVCASALAEGRQVLGLPWSWSAISGGSVVSASGLYNNCAQVTPRASQMEIVATVPGATARFTLTAGSARARIAPTAEPDLGQGDRARLARE